MKKVTNKAPLQAMTASARMVWNFFMLRQEAEMSFSFWKMDKNCSSFLPPDFCPKAIKQYHRLFIGTTSQLNRTLFLVLLWWQGSDSWMRVARDSHAHQVVFPDCLLLPKPFPEAILGCHGDRAVFSKLVRILRSNFARCKIETNCKISIQHFFLQT